MFYISVSSKEKSQFCCRDVEENRKRKKLLQNVDGHGWQVDGGIDWITEPHPDGIYNLILEQDDIKTDNEESDFYESDIERDEDDP